MRGILKKIIVILIMITMVFCFTFTFTSCKRKEKKAMILIHGIAGGCYYDSETNKAVWAIDSINSNLMEEISRIVVNIDKLKLDENGESDYDLRLATMNDTLGKYTMLAMFEPLYNALSSKYSEDYDVIVWQYDWRKPTTLAALELEKFINDNGYNKVQFFVHSMGGNVVSQYLVNSETNKNKVELFVPFSTPFFGSADAYYQVVDGLFANLGGLMNSVPVGNERVDYSNSYILIKDFVDGLKPTFSDLTLNMPSVFMLSPFAEYFNDSIYNNETTPVQIDGTYKNYTELMNFYCSQSFAKKEDGTLKKGYADCMNYQQGHMVEVNDKKVHVSNTVNTQYIVGKGVDTLKSFNINTENMTCTVLEMSEYGDGVVSTYSGTAGNSFDAENVHIIEGSSHISIISDKAAIDVCMEIVKEYLGY